MNKFLKNSISVLAAALLINICIQFFFYDEYVLLLEHYLSKDNNISFPKLMLFKINLLFVAAYLFLLDYKRKRVLSISLIDKITFALILLSIILYYRKGRSELIYSYFMEDGFFEWMTVIFALATAFIFLFNLRYFKYISSKLILSLAAFALFFFAMEEFSWGQRIFGWETSDVMSKINYQQESNLHNLFNPIFSYLYQAFTIVGTLGLLFLEKIKLLMAKNSAKHNFDLLFLDNTNLLYALVFLFLAFTNKEELIEVVFAICCLSYALNLHQFIRKRPSSRLINLKQTIE